MTDLMEEPTIHDELAVIHDKAHAASGRGFDVLGKFLELVNEIEDDDLKGEIKTVFQQLQLEWSNVANHVIDGREKLEEFQAMCAAES